MQTGEDATFCMYSRNIKRRKKLYLTHIVIIDEKGKIIIKIAPRKKENRW